MCRRPQNYVEFWTPPDFFSGEPKVVHHNPGVVLLKTIGTLVPGFFSGESNVVHQNPIYRIIYFHIGNKFPFVFL